MTDDAIRAPTQAEIRQQRRWLRLHGAGLKGFDLVRAEIRRRGEAHIYPTSLNALAEHLGISKQAFSSWGDDVPAHHVLAISMVLNLPPELLSPKVIAPLLEHVAGRRARKDGA